MKRQIPQIVVESWDLSEFSKNLEIKLNELLEENNLTKDDIVDGPSITMKPDLVMVIKIGISQEVKNST